MPNTTQGGPSAATPIPAAASYTQADVDGARAQGANAERTRVGAILTHQGAASNMALAIQCVNTGLSAEQASAILGVAPVAAAGQGNAFAAAMANIPNPAVSGVEGKGAGAEDPAAMAGSWNRAFGITGKSA